MDFDKILTNLVMKSNKVIDEIIALEQEAKRYYEETDNEAFKKLFLTLNNAYADAGHKMAQTNVQVTSTMIKVLSDFIVNGTTEGLG